MQYVFPCQDLTDNASSRDLPGGVITVRDVKRRAVA